MKRILLFLFSLFFLFHFTSCKKEALSYHYLFLGHPYDWKSDGDRIDPRLEKMPLTSFDQIWLGGDVCAKLTEKPATLEYLDGIFDFQNSKVHWAYGNHDVLYGNQDWIKNQTRQPEFYVHFENGICIVVLNTLLFIYPQSNPDPDLCRRLDAQIKMLEVLADTISAASHVVFLHHYCLLNSSLSSGQFELDKIWNFYEPNLQVACTFRGNFEEKMYPLLKRIKSKNIGVILVGGDFGMRAKEFQFRTVEGIWFLGSGVNNSVGDPALAPPYVTNFDPDKILLFDHHPDERVLEWKFLDLDSLLIFYR